MVKFHNITQSSVVALQRIWQAMAGLITAIFIMSMLSPLEQGWYYSFMNAAAMFTLFDLGLSVILVQRSAAFHTELDLTPSGVPLGANALKFSALASFSYRWYRSLAFLFVALVFPAGVYFFSLTDPDTAPVFWPLLWGILVLATAVNLWLMPSLSLIEGSGDVASVYFLRLAQGVFGAVACWLVLAIGGGLWSSLAVPLSAASIGLIWLLRCKPGLIILRNVQPKFEGRSALLAQLWRLALTWSSGFVLTQIYVPVLLAFDGPIAAGQLGLSLAIANMMALTSQSWLTSAYPHMALIAAQRDWRALRSVFRRAIYLSAAFYLLATFVLCASLMHPLLSPYSHRLLPQPALLALLGATFINQFCAALAAYIRASGLEPFAWVSLATALLTLLGATVVVGNYGVNGLVLVMLVVQLVFALPLCIWLWHVQRKQLESGT